MIKNKIKSYFYTGLILVLPIIITLYILNFILSFIISLISNSFIAIILRNVVVKTVRASGISNSEEFIFGILINVVSLIIIFVSVTLIGYTLKNVFFVKIAKKIEKIFGTMPLVKYIYSTISQIVGLVSKNKNNNYQKVVVLEYPRKGIYSLGFLTSENNIILERALNEERLCNIFIPTSPNPTSGMFVAIPAKELIILEIKVDDAIKLIISGGVIVPEILEKGEGENK
ncbi:MAG: DUF502 domain-containing protein [Fusobacteriaceae bacterium]